MLAIWGGRGARCDQCTSEPCISEEELQMQYTRATCVRNNTCSAALCVMDEVSLLAPLGEAHLIALRSVAAAEAMAAGRR